MEAQRYLACANGITLVLPLNKSSLKTIVMSYKLS